MIKMHRVLLISICMLAYIDFSEQFHLPRLLISRKATMTGKSKSTTTRMAPSEVGSASTVKLSFAKQFKVNEFLKQNSLETVYGVFLVSNSKGEVQYVSTSTESLQEELQFCLSNHGEEKVNSVRVQSFSNANKLAIDSYRQELLNQIGEMPPGNVAGWYRSDASIAASATADSTIGAKPNSDDSHVAGLREIIGKERSNFIEKSPSTPSEIESPFLQPAVVVNVDVTTALDFTVANVNKVLDEVRPYLIADGGNVEVVNIVPLKRDIILRLQGACGSCPSSTTTMKMGIERVLRENFANLGEIVSVAPAEQIVEELTAKMVEKAIEKVLPAIKSLGGIVEIKGIDNATKTVSINYKGPAKLVQGLVILIKEIPLVLNVNVDQIS